MKRKTFLAALAASAQEIYKCGAGDNTVYQDAPCKSGTRHAKVLTPANSRGTMTLISSGNTQQQDLAPFLGALPRPKPVNIQAIEEKQRLLGKPSVKQQLETPTAIEARSQSVWESVKQWFRGWLG